MKKYSVFTLLIAVMLFCSCVDNYSEYVMRGTLYTDSSQATPSSNKRLDFYEGEHYYTFDTYLGYATTDARGRWAFQYIHGLKNPNMQEGAKFQMVEYDVMIVSEGDTVYIGGPTSEMLTLYPGCIENGYGTAEPDSDAEEPAEEEETNEEEGGEK